MFIVRLGRDVKIVVGNRAKAHSRAGLTFVQSGRHRLPATKGQKPPGKVRNPLATV
jgi:hypothetical protein